MTRPRAFCDCGNPATVRLGSADVCTRCFAIDSLRLRKEREQREQSKRARRHVEEFSESVEAFHSLAT